MLEGPSKIEITDDQLEQLSTTYGELREEVLSMLEEFFTPFEIMSNEGVFTGKSADAYTEFCILINQYLKIRFDLSIQKLIAASESFKDEIDQVESYTI